MEEKKYTVVEVLEITASIMKQISIPVDLSMSVGITLSQCIGNIHKCVDFLKSCNPERSEKDGADDGEQHD